MPFTMPNFQPISPEGASPLVAALNYANKNRGLAAEIQKQQLANQYYPSDIQSQIALRREDIRQKNLQNQRAQQLLQFVTPEEIEALKQKQAATQLAQAKANYYAQHPEIFAPESIAKLEYFRRNQQTVPGAQPTLGQQASPFGGMTLTSGEDYTPPAQSQQPVQQGQPAQNAQQQYDPMNAASLQQTPYQAAVHEAQYGSPYTPQQQLTKSQLEENQKQINEDTERLSSDRDQLVLGLQNLEEFHQNYMEDKNTWFGRTGSLGGTFPSTGWSTALGNYDKEQKMDRASATIQGDVAKGLSPKMTNFILKHAGSMKIDRTLDPGSELETYNKLKSSLVRGLEEQEAVNYMTNLGVPYKQQRQLWTLYNTNLPLYNAKSGEFVQKNMNQFQNFMRIDNGKVVIHKADGWYEL